MYFFLERAEMPSLRDFLCELSRATGLKWQTRIVEVERRLAKQTIADPWWQLNSNRWFAPESVDRTAGVAIRRSLGIKHRTKRLASFSRESHTEAGRFRIAPFRTAQEEGSCMRRTFVNGCHLGKGPAFWYQNSCANATEGSASAHEAD